MPSTTLDTAQLEADTVSLALSLGEQLVAAGWMVATAESCTGGLISRALTEIGGSSQWFERGFITYSNAAKREMLGVSQRSLDVHGAVSEVVAREMAQGALVHSKAKLALAVTGVAGPGGGAPGKPVGTVAFGWASANRVESQTVKFEGDRIQVRLQTALYAMDHARRFLPKVGESGVFA